MSGERKEAKYFILKAGFTVLLSLAGFFAARHHHRRRRRRRALSPPHLSDLGPGTEPAEETPMHQNEESLAKISRHLPPLTVEDAELNDSAAMEEEILTLRNLVQSLQEREISLETKLLEFHGLKEQELFMRELQNRVKISATETKLLSLKIESLKAENEKLSSDYSELEMQRKKISILEGKLRSFAEQAREKMEVLHGRMAELIEKEKKDLEVEKKLEMFEKLENEAIELRRENFRLTEEKLAVLKRLQSELTLNGSSAHRSPDSVLKNLEMGTLEEQNQIREENENLKNKLEQLQTDRSEDVEELVYLRWINACLRYELRNYQPPQGRTVARDLSRHLSPKSEQKAKELILDYSNSNRSSLIDFDLDDHFSQTSSEDFDETSMDSSNPKSKKSKLFNKLKKLVLGKGPNEDNKMVRRSVSDLNCERRKSFGSGRWGIKRNHFYDLTRSSLDFHQNLRRLDQEEDNGGRPERCNSDLGAVFAHKRMISYSNYAENDEGGDPEKEKLKKFAQVFKDSQVSLKSKRLLTSLSIS